MDPISVPNQISPIAAPGSGAASGAQDAETFQQMLMQMASAALPIVMDDLQQLMNEEI